MESPSHFRGEGRREIYVLSRGCQGGESVDFGV